MPFLRITRTISLLPVGVARTPERYFYTSSFYIELQTVNVGVELTGVDVGEEDEGGLVELQQGVQHQAVDLDGMLDVSGDGVLQRHDVVVLLHLLTCSSSNTYRYTGMRKHNASASVEVPWYDAILGLNLDDDLMMMMI